MKKLINDGWSFAKLPPGSSVCDLEGAVFTPVDLPHDWLIWQDDLYETADAWYQRDIDAGMTGPGYTYVRFDGVYMDCDVLLNGEIICTHPYGYTAFDAVLSGKIHDGHNSLLVHIRHRNPNSRWYSGCGIFRDVFLVSLPESHIVPDGLYVFTEKDRGQWKISLSVETRGVLPEPIRCRLLDCKGMTVTEQTVSCTAPETRVFFFLSDGIAWSPENPYLYTLIIQSGGQTESRRIGLRSVMMDPDHGFFLNGKKVRLHGVCLHHDLGALGAAFHEKAARRQLSIMKQMGANAIRTSHNPPASKFLDLCDEMGFLVVDEAFDMWERSKTRYDYARFFPEWADVDVSSWIRRDRLHPCVIMWSIGNEIYDMHADERGAVLTEMLAGIVRKNDPLRHAAVTFGSNYLPWSGAQRCAEYVDAVGYNYGERLYARHHTEHPQWIIYGSETGSVLSSRGVYHFPIEQSIMSDDDGQCSSLGNSNTSWGADNLSGIITEDLNNPFSMGQFIWTGIDYIGEPTPYHSRSSFFGQVDTAGFPKDSYYLFQCFWNTVKMIHIGVTWDWNTGQMIDIPVISNCDKIELTLNGTPVGIRSCSSPEFSGGISVWKIPYTPGMIMARGYDRNGALLCEDRQITPGETEGFILSAGDSAVLSDGWDISFIEVCAIDVKGNPVRNARDRVKISVSGGARLIGTDNGDSTDRDSYKSDCRRLFNGRLTCIIGSNGEQKDAVVTVSDSKGRTARLAIPVKKVTVKDGISCIQRIRERTLPERTAVRRIDIRSLGGTAADPCHPECRFEYSLLPPGVTESPAVRWQVTNSVGIESGHARLSVEGKTITVRPEGDGAYYLRGLWGDAEGQTELISQMEITADGLGTPVTNPYQFVSAGLHDLSEGEIGSGNEKGIAFSSYGKSMIGFSRVDFGNYGSDRLTADFFALNDDVYEIELLTAEPGNALSRVMVLKYQKESIWNVYQAESWKLPERLTGIRTLGFRTDRKIHMRGFVFWKEPSAYFRHQASSADNIVGDSFVISGDKVLSVGNNVALTWKNIEFGNDGRALLEIEGFTALSVNTIHIRFSSRDEGTEDAAADFRAEHGIRQVFPVTVPRTVCDVSFVFFPGSCFDFYAFRFLHAEMDK